MEVEFTIEPTIKLASGLIFQLVYAKRIGLRSWSELNEYDFQNSIGINDKAFNLIVAIFHKHQDPNCPEEFRWAYTYNMNFHDKASVKAIVADISQLKTQLENHERPIIENQYFYAKKIQKLVSNKRIRYKYQAKMVAFLTEILAFLQRAIEDDEIFGICFVGI